MGCGGQAEVEADESLRKSKEHLDEVIKELGSIICDRVKFAVYTKDYRQAIGEAFDIARKSRQLLEY